MLPLVLAAFWSLLLLGVCLSLPSLYRSGKNFPSRPLFWLLSLAIVARLVPNWILPVGAQYDIESYEIVGRLVLNGKDVYSSPETIDRHPYLPLQMYWMAFALKLSETLRWSFAKVVRILPITADVFITLIIFQILRRDVSPQAAFNAGLWYALNPIAVFVSAYHGQFDAVPLLFTLMAFYWVSRSPAVGGGWLGLGILDKSWPVLALPSLLWATRRWKRGMALVLMAVLIPLIGVVSYLLLFDANLWMVLKRALTYNRGVGIWGYTYFIRMLSVLAPDTGQAFAFFITYGRYLTLLGLGFVWWFWARKETPLAGFLTILVAFFALTHAFAIQYLVWLVPFAILDQDYRWLYRYTLGAFAYMFLAYFTLILGMSIDRLLPWPQADWFIIMPAGLPAWLVTLGWLRKRLLRARFAQQPKEHYLFQGQPG
jgi:hypothetical protein